MDQPWIDEDKSYKYGAKCCELVWLVGCWDYWFMLDGCPEECFTDYRMNLEKQFELHQRLRIID